MVTQVPSSLDPASASARIGSVVAGKYRLERLLGTGGMGAVYEAVHTGVQRRFAVKVMTADPARSPDAVRRFTQEAQAAGLIGHPHIVEVFDLGQSDDGTLYMVMELLRGETLHAAMRGGPLAEADAVAIALELLRALGAAHRAGIVHRDIKPQNLFLVERAEGGKSLKVLDFGIAKFHEVAESAVTRSGSIVGTPLYMAPEQVLSDRDIDGRADVWAAGATLFEMLTGRPVHLAPHAAAAAVRIVTEPAARVRTLRPQVNEALDEVVARALTIERDDRYASAELMIEALEAVRDALPTSLEPPMVQSTPSRGSRPTDPSRGTKPTPVPAESRSPSAPTSPSPSGSAPSRSSAKSGLVLFGALALVGGAAAGTLLLPVPAVPLPAPSVSASMASPPRTREVADPPTPPVLRTAQTASRSTEAAPEATTEAAMPEVASAKPLAPASARSTPKRVDPKASPSSAASAPPVNSCGPREVLSNGHCCPLGMVWQDGHCDRPLAKTF
ncbi:MAG: serine/threonine protein kinase [Myxococcales bacterium]|nr:serine/threonine protein kinase [Myxococcales bacterium]